MTTMPAVAGVAPGHPDSETEARSCSRAVL
jgi:hypothetical protein